jgi:hypothetical protein
MKRFEIPAAEMQRMGAKVANYAEKLFVEWVEQHKAEPDVCLIYCTVLIKG